MWLGPKPPSTLMVLFSDHNVPSSVAAVDKLVSIGLDNPDWFAHSFSP
jgi:hypothetical protein